MNRARSQIRAVSFDVGGTLLRPRGSVGRIYADVAAEWGFPGLPPETLRQRFRTAWRARPIFNHSRAEWAELVDAAFAGFVPVPPSRTFFGELYRRFAFPKAWEVFPDALPTLRALKHHGLRLAVISNWDQRLRPLLRRLRLLGLFDAVVVSGEVGFAKPSPAIFEIAARRLRLSPNEILHVGDEPGSDLRGAREAGCQAALLARGRHSSSSGSISSLHTLEKLL